MIVAGPTAPLPAEEALAIQTFVAARRRPARRGGGPAGAERPELAPTGLEARARRRRPRPAAARSRSIPTLAMRELPGALLIADGYADHPINAGFADARARRCGSSRAR